MTDEAKDAPSNEGGDQPTGDAGTIFQQMRARLEEGQSIFPTTDEDIADAPPESVDDDPAAEEEEEGVSGGDGEEEEVVEGGEEELEAGAEDAGGDDPPPGEEKDPEAGDDIVVELPGRNPDETFEIVVDSPEAQERLNQLKNGFMRGEAVRREREELQTDREEIEEIDALLASDPAGFLLEKVKPEFRLDVLKSLLLDPDTYKALQEDEGWSEDMDDQERELQSLKTAEARRTKREEALAELNSRKAAKAGVRAISDKIGSLVPAGMSENDATRFRMASLSCARDACSRLGRLDITADQLVAALRNEGILDRFGIDPDSAPSERSEAGPRGAPGKTSASKAGEQKGKAQDPAGNLKKARARRRKVAGSAPAGAGSPPAAVALPKNQGVKDRIATVRQKGLGNFLRGKGRS